MDYEDDRDYESCMDFDDGENDDDDPLATTSVISSSATASMSPFLSSTTATFAATSWPANTFSSSSSISAPTPHVSSMAFELAQLSEHKDWADKRIDAGNDVAFPGFVVHFDFPAAARDIAHCEFQDLLNGGHFEKALLDVIKRSTGLSGYKRKGDTVLGRTGGEGRPVRKRDPLRETILHSQRRKNETFKDAETRNSNPRARERREVVLAARPTISTKTTLATTTTATTTTLSLRRQATFYLASC